MRSREVDSMDDWFATLGDHDPRPDEKVQKILLESLSRQRWGVPNPDNMAFESAVEDGYVTAEGELTPKGKSFLLQQDALVRERKLDQARKKMALKKTERRETAPKPIDMILAVFDSHGMSISRECLSVEIDDRATNSSTKNYRVMFYNKSNKSTVGLFRGTLAQILGVVDEQAVVLSESMNGMADRRSGKKNKSVPQKEDSTFSEIG